MKRNIAVRMTDWQTRVHYADTDAGGVAHHMTYLRWLEAARCEWMEDIGLGSRMLSSQFGLALAVVRAELVYRCPADLGDILTIEGEATLNGRMTLDVAQTISRDELRVVEARIKLACVDLRTRRLAPVPAVCQTVFQQNAGEPTACNAPA